MNELEGKTITPDIAEVRPDQNQAYKLLGKVKVPNGLFLWSYNTANGEINKIEPEKGTVDINGKVIRNKKVNFIPTNRYCVALNLKNAEKKFKKQLFLEQYLKPKQ